MRPPRVKNWFIGSVLLDIVLHLVKPANEGQRFIERRTPRKGCHVCHQISEKFFLFNSVFAFLKHMANMARGFSPADSLNWVLPGVLASSGKAGKTNFNFS